MAQVTYACSNHQYVANPPGTTGGHVVARPWVEVIASFQGLRHRVWCLVDTGADDTILDLGTASALNITPLHLPSQVPVVFGNGTSATFGLQQIGLDLLGMTVAANVLFGSVAVPLLGRSALLQAGTGLEAGFEPTLWQHT
ncbi:retroviral-like aspartic protease family protein [Streptomyces sp. WAC01526]|uniref:retroviral-like aspartic protease family protein n=1 Tax=Streptomyces sp. WAC01526 TaxID=2588709 RepID=UPI0011E00539|nr:retroviral-like aspartic protease family protein [Streptomyces sp. WAC01526]